MQRLLAAGLIVAAAAAAHAATVSYVTGNPDIGTLNTIVGQVNGVQCIASGASPQTCTGTRGTVTTGTLTTAAATNAAYTINNATVTANSVIVCNGTGYSGTLTTNGWPVVINCVAGAGTITVNITNTHPTNALNGTVTIGFLVAQN